MMGARSVWSGPSARKLQALYPHTADWRKRFKASKLEWGEALNGGAWTDSDAQRSGGFKVFGFLFLLLLEFSLKQNNSTVNCQKLRSFSPSSRLETDCINSKLTRMSSVQALSGYGRRICA